MSRCTGECGWMWHHVDGRVRVIVGCGVWEFPLQGAREVPRKASLQSSQAPHPRDLR